VDRVAGSVRGARQLAVELWRLVCCPRRNPGCGTRALPYELQASGAADVARGAFRIDFANTGQAGACFHVRSRNASDAPRTYTVAAGKSLSDVWDVAHGNQGRYDLSVHGPNGFLRDFRGRYDLDGYAVVLVVTNLGRVSCQVTVANAYGNDAVARTLRPGQTVHTRWSLRSSFGWYDLVVQTDTDSDVLRRLAGHVENGRGSASDPAIGQG
jgi:phospholipase C